MKSLTIAIVIGCGLLFGLLATLAVLNRHDQVAGFNQEIRYDDFAFSVQEVRTTRSIGDSTAQGVFYVVTLKVANHAKRVDYEFKRDSPVLVAGDGKQYRVSFEAQADLESASGAGHMCVTPIPPGSSCTKEVVFDVAPDITDPRLRVSTGGLAGDILDTIFYGKKVIVLDPQEGWGNADCGLRIADCGLLDLRKPGFRNPKSAIRNPQFKGEALFCNVSKL
jgi:hypothetical protein